MKKNTSLIIKTIICAFIALSSCNKGNKNEGFKRAAHPENQRTADLENGYYLNPILGGDYPDPSVLKYKDAYYMTHSFL